MSATSLQQPSRADAPAGQGGAGQPLEETAPSKVVDAGAPRLTATGVCEYLEAVKLSINTYASILYYERNAVFQHTSALSQASNNEHEGQSTVNIDKSTFCKHDKPLIPVSFTNKHSPLEEDTWEDMLSEHRVRRQSVESRFFC